MKNPVFPKVLSLAALLCITLSSVLQAGTVTWNSTITNGDFNVGSNWIGGSVPLSGNDTAQITASLPTTITGNITFTSTLGKTATGGTAAVTYGASVGANTITIFNGTGDGILAGTANVTSTVNNNVVLGDGSTSTISLTSNVANALLDIKGSVSGGTGGTAGNLTLSLGSTGTKSGDYNIAGNISKGGAAQILLNHRGNGTVTISGTNVVDKFWNNEAGGTLRVNGGSTTINNAYSTANGWGGATVANTIRVSAGSLNTNDGRGLRTNLVVDGGTFNIGANAVSGNSSRLSFDANAAFQTNTFNLSSGSVNFIPNYLTSNFGVRFGGDNGPTNTGVSFAGVQTGGNFTVNGGGAATQVFSLGSNSTGVTASYALSGGLLDIKGTNSTNGRIDFGADNTAGTSTTTFSLSGSAKLLVRSTPGTHGISGSQAAGAFSPAQVFSMTGGTLVAGNIVATNLRGSPSDTNGTFINNGGSIAPGDIGFSGKTAVTGALTVTTGTLVIDIGGNSSSTAWQDAASSGKYDNVTVSTLFTLGGTLSISLIDGFTPTSGQSFTIATMGSSSGVFTNILSGKVFTADNLGQFDYTNSGTSIVLSNFIAVPEPSTWALLGISLSALLVFRRRTLPEPKGMKKA
jgi:fibronectin-binding autotransporter adhesin